VDDHQFWVHHRIVKKNLVLIIYRSKFMIHYHMHQQHMRLQRTEGHFFSSTINLLSFKSWVCILGLTIACFVFSGVIFCLDFDPFFFFLLLFPCQVFFLYLFIYLFMFLFNYMKGSIISFIYLFLKHHQLQLKKRLGSWIPPCLPIILDDIQLVHVREWAG